MLYAFMIELVVGRILGAVAAENEDQAKASVNDWYIENYPLPTLRSATLGAKIRPAMDCCPDFVIIDWVQGSSHFQWDAHRNCNPGMTEELPASDIDHCFCDSDKLFSFEAYWHDDYHCSGAVIAANMDQAQERLEDYLGDVGSLTIHSTTMRYPNMVLMQN